LWAVVSASVPVPVWVLALITLAGLGFVLHAVRLKRAAVGAPKISAEALRMANPHPISISTLECDVLERIAKADGEAVPQDTIKRSLGATNLRLQAAVDQLVALDLVEVLEDEDDGEVALLLTARGRQYALENRLAR